MRVLQRIRSCRACGDSTTRGVLCRECAFDLLPRAPVAHAAIYGDYSALFAVASRGERFERGDFGR